MVDNTWAFKIGSQVYSALKADLESTFKTKYSSFRVTNKSADLTKAVFPTVYMKEESGAETDSSFEIDEIVAILETYTITVSSKDENVTNAIMQDVQKYMKTYRFTITSTPIPSSDGDVYKSIARFRRKFSKNSSLV